MKISEKYKVNGNVNNQQVSGEVTIYPNNFTNVPKKSIIAGFRTSLKELKRKFTDMDKNDLRNLNVVSTDENACWLIDYWCGKDIRGLIQMPFSRHWIMHIEASLRIRNKIKR